MELGYTDFITILLVSDHKATVWAVYGDLIRTVRWRDVGVNQKLEIKQHFPANISFLLLA
jgi:hypothetical protein